MFNQMFKFSTIFYNFDPKKVIYLRDIFKTLGIRSIT